MQNKDYSDYFKALEENLNKSVQKENEIFSSSAPLKKEKPRSKRRFRRRINLRAVFACIFILLFLSSSIYLISFAFSDSSDSSTKTENNQSYVEKEQTDKNDKNKNENKIIFKEAEHLTPLAESNDAKNAIMINLSTNEILLAKNAYEKAYPASTTKIMTLLVACENLTNLKDTFTMTLSITDPLYVQKASVAGFLNNEVITVEDMLYGTILPSGADAAVGLAIKIAGSEAAFVNLMNKKVKDLGLKNTHFSNVSGLHSSDNYSTAYDMAVILAAALKNPTAKKVLSTYQYRTSITPQNPEGILLSSTLFSYMYGTEPETATILGGKTGFVNESGYCVASFGKANETSNEYILVTFGNSGKWPAFYGQFDLYKQLAK